MDDVLSKYSNFKGSSNSNTTNTTQTTIQAGKTIDKTSSTPKETNAESFLKRKYGTDFN